jgi:hypothetical protein
MKRLRRSLAILLIWLAGLAPLIPALGLDSEAKLPVCCRRNGAHHCSIQTGSDSTKPGVGVGVEGDPRCPRYPRTVSSTGPVTGMQVVAAVALKIPCVEQANRLRHGRAILPYSHTTAHPKRGPPSCAWPPSSFKA